MKTLRIGKFIAVMGRGPKGFAPRQGLQDLTHQLGFIYAVGQFWIICNVMSQVTYEAHYRYHGKHAAIWR